MHAQVHEAQAAARRGKRPRVRRRDRVGAIERRRSDGRGEAVRVREARATAPHLRQRGVGARSAARGLPLLRRLPDHALVRDPALPFREACPASAAPSSRRKTSSPRSGASSAASFAGVKSMTATSGPGLSLMIEMIGLASMAEVPAVIVDVQRGGPSTGNPTHSEQSDLLQSLFGTHGDAPRVVLACADVEDCFHATVEAFNISEEFQLPVLVLSDQAVGQRKETLSAQTLVHEVRRPAPPDRGGPRPVRALPRYRDGRIPHGHSGNEGRDVPDERPRARRGGPAQLAVPRAREDEREAVPEDVGDPRPLSLPPPLRARESEGRHRLLGLLEGARAGGGPAGATRTERASPPSSRR